MTRFGVLALAAALLLFSLAARAQQGVLQSGLVTPGHAAMWSTSGVIMDAGSTAPPSTLNTRLTGLGIVGSGSTDCRWTAYAQPYAQLCLGFDALGNGLLSYSNVGAPPTGTINFNINGAVTTMGAPPILTPTCTADGTHDCSAAINTAAQTIVNGQFASVYLPAGTYFLANPVTIGNGQKLYCEARGNTTITRNSTFPAAAAGEVILTGREQLSPSVQNCTFLDAQPTAATSSLTGCTISNGSGGAGTAVACTIASGTPANGNLIYGTGVAANTTLSAVSIVGSSLTATASVSQLVTPGVAMSTALGRSQFLPLGTCDAVTTGCAYSPNIVLQTANRVLLRNLQFKDTWKSIANTAGNSIGGFHIENIEDGALSVGLNLFSSFDFGFIKAYNHGPNFLIGGSTGALGALWKDGNTIAGIFGVAGTIGGLSGEVDYVEISGWSPSQSRTQIANTNSWMTFTAAAFDSTNATLEIGGGKWIQLVDSYWSGTATGANTNSQIQMSAGRVLAVNPIFSSTTLAAITKTGGSLQIVGGQTFVNTGNVTVIADSGPAGSGTTQIIGHHFDTSHAVGTWTSNCLVANTSGAAPAIQFQNNVFDATPGDVGGLCITTDSGNNIVTGNQFNGWGWIPPAVGAGVYSPNDRVFMLNATLNSSQLLTGAQSGTIVNNCSAGAPVIYTLPSASSTGFNYGFYVCAAQQIELLMQGGNKLQIGSSVTSANGNATNSTIGSYVHVDHLGGSVWFADSVIGTWVTN